MARQLSTLRVNAELRDFKLPKMPIEPEAGSIGRASEIRLQVDEELSIPASVIDWKQNKTTSSR